MNLIKNAIIYQADLPAIDAMLLHLSELPFKPVGKSFVSSAGFVPNGITAELVTPIEGGYSFSVRLDEKILPRSSVLAAIAEAVQEYADENDLLLEEMHEDDVARIEDAVRTHLIENALVKSTVVHCFYSAAHQFLIVPTTKKDLASTVVSLLITCIGSVKTSTIHVDNIKGGLTTRLKNHFGLEGDDLIEDAFGGFKLGATCNMAVKSDKVSFSMGDLDAARAGLIECLEKGMSVDIMELTHEGVAFKLTHDFKLKGLSFFGQLTDEEQAKREDADAAYFWRLEAAVQLLQVTALILALCELFKYQRPSLEQMQVAKADADAVPQGDDPLYEEAKAFVIESRRPSVSAVQRKLKIGYNRAARMLERLELDGVVTAMNSNGHREVIA